MYIIVRKSCLPWSWRWKSKIFLALHMHTGMTFYLPADSKSAPVKAALFSTDQLKAFTARFYKYCAFTPDTWTFKDQALYWIPRSTQLLNERKDQHICWIMATWFLYFSPNGNDRSPVTQQTFTNIMMRTILVLWVYLVHVRVNISMGRWIHG